MKDLLLATNNSAKIAEISYFLADLPLKLVTLKDLKITAEAPEDGLSFKDNARSKANFYLNLSGLPCLADDGGIEVDVLGGEPGVASHRWVSKTHDDSDDVLINYLFEKMKNVELSKRGAQMHVVLALLLPNGEEYFSEGIVRGVIAREISKHRTPGFPFRSVLYLPEIKKYYDHTELSVNENARYNHRRLALERIKPYLLKYINS